jgi:hypothetical protein
MNKLMLVVLGVLTFSTNAVASTNLDDSTFNRQRILLVGNAVATSAAVVGAIAWNPQQDKVRHFFAGYAIGSITNGVVQLLLPKDTNNKQLISGLAGFGASILAGAAKEYWDSKGNGHPEWGDALSTAGGGLVGTIAMSFDLDALL